MIAAGHHEVSVDRRYELLGVTRTSYYRGPVSGLRQGDLELMLRIDELYLQLWIDSDHGLGNRKVLSWWLSNTLDIRNRSRTLQELDYLV